MQIEILQENLLRALSRTGRIVSPKPQLPILSSVVINAHDGEVHVISTNMETTEVVTVPAKISEEGGICVSSRLLTELVSSLSPGTVKLMVNEVSLDVSSGRTHATIPGSMESEFPPVVTSTKTSSVSLPKEILLQALKHILFSAATDDGRPLLTGIKIKKQDEDLVFAATDGYRLSVVRLPNPFSEDLDIVVPARALAEVVKISGEEKQLKEIELTQTEEGQLIFGLDTTQVVTRLIAGEYPSYERIIPKTHTTTAKIDKEQFAQAVKSAAIFARDNANIIRLKIEPSTVVVSANTPQVGTNSIEVEASVEGDGGEIAFNSRFLVEFLNNHDGDDVVFEMTGSLNPGVFRSSTDSSSFHVIMPVRVQS